jgi:hypothetical protein
MLRQEAKRIRARRARNAGRSRAVRSQIFTPLGVKSGHNGPRANDASERSARSTAWRKQPGHNGPRANAASERRVRTSGTSVLQGRRLASLRKHPGTTDREDALPDRRLASWRCRDAAQKSTRRVCAGARCRTRRAG